ncbi:MAG TPA: hypothetical protein VD710_06820 [Nitrososphaeraceae archaeon]|nr:hypothetical protein [Nitrososphaeraceae archaeon]
MTDIRDKHYINGNLRGNKKVIWDPIRVTAGIILAVVSILSIYIQNSGAVTNLLIHNHVSLNVTIDGTPIIVPTHIGMNQTWIFADPLLYADHSLDKYGMEGMSPLQAHDSSGVIHVESNKIRYYTLGEFLDIWKGLNTDGKNVIATEDGSTVSEFRGIVLNNGSKIVLDITSKVS